MKLYYVPRTRSMRPRWILEELEVPYELVPLDPRKGETRTDEHTTRHPLQHVPVLETRDGAIFESAAIVLHLADLFPDKKLLGAPGTHARALTYQWLFFAMTELEPPIVLFQQAKEAGQLEACEAQKQRFRQALAPLERRFSAYEFMVGDAFTAADVVVASVLSYGKLFGLLEGAPHCEAYLARMKARPAFKRALA